jgi:hypothetical protein
MGDRSYVQGGKDGSVATTVSGWIDSSLKGKLGSFNQMLMSTADDAKLCQVPSPMGNHGMGWSVPC